MRLNRLKISRFRALSSVDLALSDKFNLFYGNNASGKTSLLEAIYYLSLNKSFRSSLTQRIIQHGQAQLTLFAEIGEKRVGLEKNLSGETKIRISGVDVKRSSELARALAVILVNSDTFRLLNAGPECRRQFLDWGVFHVEHSFVSLWQTYYRTLKQRNAALRAGLSEKEIKTWNEPLINLAQSINTYRKQYFDLFMTKFPGVLGELLTVSGICLSYYPGWSKDKAYSLVLDESLNRDRQLGYTQFGAHRAEIKVSADKIPAKEVLSRGQQKLFVAAMCVTQGLLYKEATKESPVYLIDDLASELDREKRQLLLDLLVSLDAQSFVTVVDCAAVDFMTFEKMFHVEHGAIQAETEKL
jgi:DNA replication and repair protein RecF